MKLANHFETAVVIHDGVNAYDTGVCTHRDDVKVDVVIPDGSPLTVAYRYGDGRESDELPEGLKYLSAKEAREQFGIRITFED